MGPTNYAQVSRWSHDCTERAREEKARDEKAKPYKEPFYQGLIDGANGWNEAQARDKAKQWDQYKVSLAYFTGWQVGRQHSTPFTAYGTCKGSFTEQCASHFAQWVRDYIR